MIIKKKPLADEDVPYSHCQLRNLKEYKLVIVRTMLYMRIRIVSSKRLCDGTLVKRNQKVNLELSMRVRTCFESSSGASFYARHRRLQNASDWWQSACDLVFSFPLSFARKFSSKKRRLGTRECAHNARFDLSLTTWTNLVGTETACLSHMKFCNSHLLQPEWVEKIFMHAKWGET